MCAMVLNDRKMGQKATACNNSVSILKVCASLSLQLLLLSLRVILAREDLITANGTVSDITGGGNYVILLESGTRVTARLSGKMKKFKIRVLVGDKVTVGVSPYDPTHGLITHRLRAY